MPLPSEMKQQEDHRFEDLSIEFVTTDRPAPQGMVVLMPSALGYKRADRNKVVFNRYTWLNQWPLSQVISFADPAMKQSEKLDGAWFIHPKYDLIRAISEITGEMAIAANVPLERVVFYGSSLGGFGAIAAAAHLPGSRAVAEIPQIDFENWNAVARKAVETHVTGMPLKKYRKVHPEQICLRDRLEYAGVIPPFAILTNPSEVSLSDQLDFYAWARLSSLPRIGALELFQSTRTSRHSVLEQADVVRFIEP